VWAKHPPITTLDTLELYRRILDPYEGEYNYPMGIFTHTEQNFTSPTIRMKIEASLVVRMLLSHFEKPSAVLCRRHAAHTGPSCTKH